MDAAIRFAVVLGLLAQTASPRDLLNTDRPLTPTEIASVLSASQQAVANKTFRMSWQPGSAGAEVLMGSIGRPRLIRTSGVVIGGTSSGIVGGVTPGTNAPPVRVSEFREEWTTIVDYTGRPARRCNAAADARSLGELVINYEKRGSTNAWTTRAGFRDAAVARAPVYATMFEMLSGATPVTSSGRRQIDGRWARAFVAPWTPPEATRVELTGDPLPNVVGTPLIDPTETLWIDVESLLPVRWETTTRGYDFNLTYEPIDLQLPAGVERPDCIR